MIHASFIFWGTDEFSVIVLDELKKAGFAPALIVTATDKKMGRGMKLKSPPAKLWAEKNAVPFVQPEKLDDFVFRQLSDVKCQMFLVASYGKIIPARFLALPARGALNVHPSLLPKYRGASPLESQILDGAEEVGVTIMLMDEKMDHGPILAQERCGKPKEDLALRSPDASVGAGKGEALRRVFHSVNCPDLRDIRTKELHDVLAHLGGALLAETIPKWISGELEAREQEHDKATYTKKITKEDGLIDLADDPELNYRKFLAYTPWPSVYFFAEPRRGGVERDNNAPPQNASATQRKLRVKITDAELDIQRESAFSPRGSAHKLRFVIKKVIPEGKKEMGYAAFTDASREPRRT